MRRRAFTLIELLTVMSIIGILCAIFAPVALKARNAASQLSAVSSLRQLGPATSMYMADSDDRYPIPFQQSMDSGIAWYGTVDSKGNVDPKTGLLAPYLGGRAPKDPTFQARKWRGNQAGFGYNWGFLGSRYYYGNDRVDWMVPALSSELSDPTKTIVYATSVYYFAKWNQGDGVAYDYAYIDPPFAWNGSPTVDCRHMGTKRVVDDVKAVEMSGVALALHADGHMGSYRLGQIRNDMFVRQPRATD